MATAFQDLVGIGQAAIEQPALEPMREDDTVYYNSNNSLVQRAPVQSSTRLQLPLTSLSLPSAGNTIQIPNISVLESVVLRLVPTNSTVPSNSALPNGWGYELIDKLEYRIGASTQYTCDGKQHFLSLMNQCETQEKQQELINLGGLAVVSAGATGEANVMINIPITIVKTLFQNKPLDLLLLSSPVIITVYLKDINTIATLGSNFTSSLSYGVAFVKQLDWVNQVDSYADELRSKPSEVYMHPIIFEQHARIQNVSTSAGVSQQVTLNSFRAGTLLSIVVAFFDQATNTTSTARNGFNFTDMRDLQLIYNGQTIVNMPGDSAKAFQALQKMHGGYFPYLPITAGTPPTIAASSQIRYYELPVSQFAANWQNPGHEQAGLYIGTNVMNLAFSTVGSITNGTLYLIYNYSSAVKITQGGARSDLVF